MLTWARADKSSATLRRDSVARLLSRVPVSWAKAARMPVISVPVPDSWPSTVRLSQTAWRVWSDSR